MKVRSGWRFGVFIVVTGFVLAGCSASAFGATYTVVSTADSGAGSLRQAIDDANGNSGLDTISFDIPEGSCSGAGVCEILLDSDLPDTFDAVIIDGSSQPRYGTAPSNVCATASLSSYMRVQIIGTSGARTFTVTSPDPTVIRGLSLGGGYPISLRTSAAHRVECNHIGVDAEGTGALVTSGRGITIEETGASSIIGTNGDGVSDISERNVIRDSSRAIYINANSDNRISGNFFGFGADGITQLSSGTCIYMRQSSTNNLVGTDGDGTSDTLERNIIGNCSQGVEIDSRMGGGNANRVIGNWIGVNAKGQIASNSVGIEVSDTGLDHVIRDNLIAVNGTGINLLEDANLSVTSTGNCVSGNVSGLTHGGTAAVSFESNWWGAADGPSGTGPGSGDGISETNTGTVDFDPWLVSTPPSCPSFIFVDGFESGNTLGWSSSVP